jgi:hypothetical protein
LREEQDIVVAPSIGSRLRAAVTEQDWSYTKLIAAMRRVAAARGESLPETRSLVTTLSRWFNDHERPSDFYQGLLCEALSKSRAQLASRTEATLKTRVELSQRTWPGSSRPPTSVLWRSVR